MSLYFLKGNYYISITLAILWFHVKQLKSGSHPLFGHSLNVWFTQLHRHKLSDHHYLLLSVYQVNYVLTTKAVDQEWDALQRRHNEPFPVLTQVLT